MYSRHGAPALRTWLAASGEDGPALPAREDVEAVVARVRGNIPAQVQVPHEEIELAVRMRGAAAWPVDIDAGAGCQHQAVLPVLLDAARIARVLADGKSGPDGPARVIELAE